MRSANELVTYRTGPPRTTVVCAATDFEARACRRGIADAANAGLRTASFLFASRRSAAQLRAGWARWAASHLDVADA